MNKLVELASKQFQSAFGYQASNIVQAPARVNLIGEHTDYNDGFVLPCAINFSTVVAASKRSDGVIRTLAVNFEGEIDEFSLDASFSFQSLRMWPNYIRGVVAAIQQSEGQQGDKLLGGADLVVAGNIPQGAGLSSSASLEVAICLSLKNLYGLSINETEIAQISQKAENEFVGCNCGIMDQLIAVLGKRNNAMLIDCRTLQATPVAIPAGTRIVIINSNKKRGLVDSAYNERRTQCEAAAQYFGVNALRDVSLDELTIASTQLDPLVFRRARHVITENQRTLQAAEALRAGDISKMAVLMAASHESMRRDFEITVPEIDYLVDIIQDTLGEVGGVRMTGGGFGGCVVALAPKESVNEIISCVESSYARVTGLKESILVCNASDGASAISND